MSKSLLQYTMEQQEKLSAFEQWWILMHDKEPDKYPLVLPDGNEGLWDEQFDEFDPAWLYRIAMARSHTPERMMLGQEGRPSLLVEPSNYKDPNNFEFWVINGCWKGKAVDGKLFVHSNPHPFDFDVLCADINRLRGDYNDVFNNFDNLNYVAPLPKKVYITDTDDDIAF